MSEHDYEADWSQLFSNFARRPGHLGTFGLSEHWQSSNGRQIHQKRTSTRCDTKDPHHSDARVSTHRIAAVLPACFVTMSAPAAGAGAAAGGAAAAAAAAAKS